MGTPRDELAALDRAHLWHPFTQHSEWNAVDPLVIHRAEGCWLVDGDGRRYLDGVSSLWANVHGHRVPEIDEAVRQQLDRVAHSTMLGLSHPPGIRLAAHLARLAPPGLRRVFFSDNGSTAVEVALKMAFQVQQHRGETHRTRFAALEGAYHGDTVGAVSVGAIPLFHEVYRPLLFDSVVLPAPVTAGGSEEEACLAEALRRLDAASDTLAAIVMEPLVQGAAGMKMHSAHFAATLARAARDRGALVIFDEVAVGLGRTGTLFATEQVGVVPDLLALAKGLAGGYLPLAATLATDAVYEAFLAPFADFRQLFHGHTFTGNPLACAAALASLDLFAQRDVLAHVALVSDRLARALASLSDPRVAAVRQCGVLVGIDLRRSDGSCFTPAHRAGHRAAMAARGHGAIVRPLGDTLVLNPPLAVTLDEVDHLVRAAAAGIATLP